MKKVTLLVDEKMETELESLQDRLLTSNLSYVIRIAIHQLFLQNSISNEISKDTAIPRLPGMNEDVIESQIRRFRLSPEEYSSIVRQTIDNFAASGKPMNNPEAAIYGACKRYVNDRHQQTDAAKDTPTAGNTKPSYLELQDQLP